MTSYVVKVAAPAAAALSGWMVPIEPSWRACCKAARTASCACRSTWAGPLTVAKWELRALAVSSAPVIAMPSSPKTAGIYHPWVVYTTQGQAAVALRNLAAGVAAGQERAAAIAVVGAIPNLVRCLSSPVAGLVSRRQGR